LMLPIVMPKLICDEELTVGNAETHAATVNAQQIGVRPVGPHVENEVLNCHQAAAGPDVNARIGGGVQDDRRPIVGGCPLDRENVARANNQRIGPVVSAARRAHRQHPTILRHAQRVGDGLRGIRIAPVAGYRFGGIIGLIGAAIKHDAQKQRQRR
jgi:hypothetical protein